MRRPLVTSTFALVVAIAPAMVCAQTAPPAQPPATQPPAQAAPAAPVPGAGAFTAPAGMFLNTIKADQTAAFEDTMAKLKEAVAKSAKPAVKEAAAGWKIYRALEPAGPPCPPDKAPCPPGNVLYIFVMDPAVKDFDYSAVGVFTILQEGLGDATAREIFEKFRNAFGSAQNKLNLTPMGTLGGM